MAAWPGISEHPTTGTGSTKIEVGFDPYEHIRTQVIRECVTWLAMNHADYNPESLAGEMARNLLTE